MAVNFLVNTSLEGVAIFDEQRLGKTPTVLTALKIKQATPLIVVPTSLLYPWKTEYLKWYNDDVVLITGSKEQRKLLYKQKKAMIISYTTLSNDIDLIMKLKHFDYIVIDEAHRIRNLKHSKKFKPKLATNLLKISRKIKNRIALTGTPASNYADDVFGILQFLYPDIFASYYNFSDYYFKQETCYVRTPNGVDTISKCTGQFKDNKADELLEFLDTISIQRKRSEVMTWLPKYDITPVTLPMSSEQQKAYDMLNNVFEYKDTICLTTLELMLALRQLTMSPELLKCDTQGCKFKFITEYLEDYPEKSVIIVSTLVEPLKLLSKLLSPKQHEIVTGSTSAKNRDKIKNDFQNKKYNLLLANLDVIKEGFTLDTADTIIFLNSSYIYTDNIQCMDRLVPVSQENVHKITQNIIILLAKDSIDEYIYDMVYNKKASSSDIVNNYKNYRKETLCKQDLQQSKLKDLN